MTSATGVNSSATSTGNVGWSCGLNYILNELGRLASLEYPIYPPWKENSSESHKATASASASSKTPTPSFQSEASTMPIPRISLTLPRPALIRPDFLCKTPSPFHPLSTSASRLGDWSGRNPDEHAVNRTDEKDVQSKPSHQAMREKESGDSMGRGISEKGGEENKKAEKEAPEAPKPVIGMNDERGGKGH